jgi:hypothetical protein
MRNFKEFNIAPTVKSFVGTKVFLDNILDTPIIIHDYKVETSKFERGNGKCLHLQISINGTKHVLFTSSMGLMSVLEQIPRSELPFGTTIVKDKQTRRFEFT